MARTRGPITTAILSVLKTDGPLAVRELAQRIGAPVCIVEKAVSRLKSADLLQMVCLRRFPWARRPLAVYAPADATPATVGFVDLLQAWR